MRRLQRILLVLLVSMGLMGGALAAPTQATSETEGPSVLTAVRTGHHPGFDRIVFDFEGGLPSHREVRWSDGPRYPGSGAPMNVHGDAFLEVTLHAHTSDELYGGPGLADPDRAIALPNLNDMRAAPSFEGVVTVGFGLMKRTEILRTFTLENPSRYVIDVSTDFPQRWAPVYFFDEDRVVTGEEPLVRHVLRRVPFPAVANGQLHRFYAGPTPAEADDGLILVHSLVLPSGLEQDRRTGFTGLRVSDGVLHMRFTRPCSSGGSTMTVAGELMPTLKYWSTVDHVKIYDEDGTTQEPTGRSDSVPVCLEP